MVNANDNNIGLIILLFLICGVFIIVNYAIVDYGQHDAIEHNHNHINMIDDKLQHQQIWLEEANKYGWHEECIGNGTTTYDFYGVNRSNLGIEVEYGGNTGWDSIIIVNDKYYIIGSKNESYCNKWRLVKNE